MSNNEDQRKEFVRTEICSVADEFMDIEPEDNSATPVYCLKHKYLTDKEYWMEGICFSAGTEWHKGIRIHKSKSKACPRRNFVGLFNSVNSFTDSQSLFIAETINYLFDCIDPSKKEVGENLVSNYVRDHKQYCFNYYTGFSKFGDFYICDGFIKFENKPLTEHLKINFNIEREGLYIRKVIEFYVYDNKLRCSTMTLDGAFTVIDGNYKPEVLACNILKYIINPIVKNLDYSLDDINPTNIKDFFENVMTIRKLNEMVEI